MAWLVELLLPSRCVSCGSSATVLCERCLRGLRRLGPPSCGLCGAPTVWQVARCRECSGRRLAFASARAAVAYTGPARSLVSAWKEHGLRRAASLAATLVVDTVEAPAADVITYVPADPTRLLLRGHHPPERLAQELGRRWSLPVAELLGRGRGSPARRQTELGRAERRTNVRGAFAAAAAAVPPRLVLVDDVYTTGATASSAAGALTRAGAHRVDVVTFARTCR